MVVDDNVVALAYVEDVLECEGFSVVALDSPFAVSAALTAHRPDLLLVDVSMPALAGTVVVEVLRRHARHSCPVVLYSDRSPAELRNLASACGASGYIAKSSDPGSLCRQVASFCGVDYDA